jgi:putative hydrolase of the HAD superfamily
VAEHLCQRLKAEGDPADLFETWMWMRFLDGQSAGAIDALNHRFRLNLKPPDLAEVVEVYRTHSPNIRPYEGASEFLGRLREHYRIGLLTDGRSDSQKQKLQALGLERFFDAVVFTDELGKDCWKPSTAGFEEIRRRLDVPHEACAYVGDNPAKDFLPGNRLGWRTIRMVRPGQVHAGTVAPPEGHSQFTVWSLEDLRNALREEE